MLLLRWQLRELEADLEEERKQRSLATSAKKKLEGDIKDMQGQVEMATKVKEDAIKQLKRLQAHVKVMKITEKLIQIALTTEIYWKVNGCGVFVVFQDLQRETEDALRAAEAYRNIVKAIDEAYNASVDAKASGQTALNIVGTSLLIV